MKKLDLMSVVACFFAMMLVSTSFSAETISAIGTIIDNDAPPVVEVPSLTVAEGNMGESTNVVFTITMNVPSGQVATVDYQTNDITATDADGDYVTQNGTLTFAVGETEKQVTVIVNGDNKYEPDERFSLEILNPTNSTIGQSIGECIISNDDAAPIISIADVSVDEGDDGIANAIFVVSLSIETYQDVSFNYETSDISASQGVDYVSTSGTATIPAGSLSQTITVEVIGDLVDEPDEQFKVNLSSPINATF